MVYRLKNQTDAEDTEKPEKMEKIKVSVLFTTYNQPEWLWKTLLGFKHQTFRDFEIIIADDGSGPETKAVIEEFQSLDKTPPVHHLWHEDQGFQKTVILNKALAASKGEYLIFTDGDCIPSSSFVQTHLDFRKNGHFLSGGAIRLPKDLSDLISDDDILQKRCFDYKWLRKNGMPWSIHNLKAVDSGLCKSLLSAASFADKTWNGNNSSCWRVDAMRVKGFDERMQYGGEDCEFGDRLKNCGVKPISVRYHAKTLHLDHGRPYVNDQAKARNDEIRKTTQVENLKVTKYGLP